MPGVITLWAASPVPVQKDTVEMDLLAQVKFKKTYCNLDDFVPACLFVHIRVASFCQMLQKCFWVAKQILQILQSKNTFVRGGGAVLKVGGQPNRGLWDGPPLGSGRCGGRNQLNSTQLTTPKEEWFNKTKEAKKAYIYPRFFSKQSRCFLKVAIVSQLINDRPYW